MENVVKRGLGLVIGSIVDQSVVIFNLNAVGCQVVALLAIKGVSHITICDEGEVTQKDVDAPGSLYHKSDINKLKTDVVTDLIKKTGNSSVRITAINDMCLGNPAQSTTAIDCIDEMTTKDLVWRHIKASYMYNLFIGMQDTEVQAKVFAFSPCSATNINAYEAFQKNQDSKSENLLVDGYKVDSPFCTALTIVSIAVSFWQTGDFERSPKVDNVT